MGHLSGREHDTGQFELGVGAVLTKQPKTVVYQLKHNSSAVLEYPLSLKTVGDNYVT